MNTQDAGKQLDGLSGFAQRLKMLRKQRGFSQTELAELVGLHYTHIGRYERGISQPTAEPIQKLAEAFGVSGDFLLSGSTEEIAKASLEDRELLRLFSIPVHHTILHRRL